MATLKEKAGSKKSSGGSLATKAKSRSTPRPKAPVEEPPEPQITMPNVINTSPPPPAALLYLKLFSSIPGLRRGSQDGAG